MAGQDLELIRARKIVVWVARVITYLIYLALSLALTVWVARTLHRNGRVFLVDVFAGNTELADSNAAPESNTGPAPAEPAAAPAEPAAASGR